MGLKTRLITLVLLVLMLGVNQSAAHPDADNDAACEGFACVDVEWTVEDCEPTCTYTMVAHHWWEGTDAEPSPLTQGSGSLALDESGEEVDSCEFRFVPVVMQAHCVTEHQFEGPEACHVASAITETETFDPFHGPDTATTNESVFCEA